MFSVFTSNDLYGLSETKYVIVTEVKEMEFKKLHCVECQINCSETSILN